MNGWSAAANFALALLSPPVLSVAWNLLFRVFRHGGHFIAGWLCGACSGTTSALIRHDWAFASGAAASAAIGLAAWWWRRRKDRRKTLAAAGAKAKARIAAMVGAMRERARPRPVLKPGLQGAR